MIVPPPSPSPCPKRSPWFELLVDNRPKQVLLRAYTRFFMVKNVAADDWWMFAAMVRLLCLDPYLYGSWAYLPTCLMGSDCPGRLHTLGTASMPYMELPMEGRESTSASSRTKRFISASRRGIYPRFSTHQSPPWSGHLLRSFFFEYRLNHSTERSSSLTSPSCTCSNICWIVFLPPTPKKPGNFRTRLVNTNFRKPNPDGSSA